MVYIHGGTFTTGGADIYHWKVVCYQDKQRKKKIKTQGAVRNLVSRGVVVVTIQYRLGMIGFFTTYTENFPPNRGLYDQVRTFSKSHKTNYKLRLSRFAGSTRKSQTSEAIRAGIFDKQLTVIIVPAE